MEFNAVNADTIKFEMRGMSGDTAVTQEKKKKGFFGRLFSGLLKLVAAPLSVLGMAIPPAGLAAAGAYGLSQTIDIAQANSAAKRAAQNVPAQPQSYYLPGVDTGGMSDAASGAAPGSTAVPSAMRQQVMDVLYARNDAMMDSTAAFKKGKEVAHV